MLQHEPTAPAVAEIAVYVTFDADVVSASDIADKMADSITWLEGVVKVDFTTINTQTTLKLEGYGHGV